LNTIGTQHPLRGAYAKCERAVEHHDRCLELFGEFIQNHSFSIADTDPGAPSGRLGSETVWTEISCVVGDAIHNLRAALDHVAYAVAADRLHAKYLKSVYFTIRSDRAAFDKAMRKGAFEQLMGSDWRAFLLGVQPFQGQKYEDLGRISALDNTDKHRLLFSLAPRSDVHNLRDDGQWEAATLNLNDGLVLVPTHDKAFMIASHYLSLPDAPSGKKPSPVELDLLNFYSLVSDVVRQAQAEFFS
jgi:hypothetical protein